MLTSLIKKIYYHPVHGTGITNRLVYKLILRFNNGYIVGYMKDRLMKKYMREAQNISAYRGIYNGPQTIFHKLPVICKQNFHIDYPDVKDRLPDNATITDLHILKTSGSTSGKPSEIPMTTEDFDTIRNYYRLFGRLAKEIMPLKYKYVNMFPISNSSTGILSEQVVPVDFRLGRSDADPAETYNIIINALSTKKLLPTEPLILGGLPILHLEFMDYLRTQNLQNLSVDNANNILEIVSNIKRNGICLYGGESPTIHEKLLLHSYYNKVAGVFGSTELGPKLGFSIELNLIFDIMLENNEFCQMLNIDRQTTPITFFFDKYLHHYEIVNKSLVITPLIQQTELKLRWDQDDYCQLINPQELVSALKKSSAKVSQILGNLDQKYNTNLVSHFVDMYHGKYDNLIKYFGLMLFYGRKGIIFGGANLDNTFMETVSDKLHETKLGEYVQHIAIHRPITKETDDVNTNNYSGLSLDILVDIKEKLSPTELLELKNDIIDIMRKEHHDLDKILEYYEHHGKLEQILNSINIIAYTENNSPMHDRFIASKKRNHIINKIDDKYNQYTY